jgi:mitochondrial import receptor subunit TOM22
MIPPTTRRRIVSTFSTASSYVRSGFWFGGKAAWVVSTSALLFGIPFALCIVDEQANVEREQEEQARRMGQELLAPGASGQPAPGQANPAL